MYATRYQDVLDMAPKSYRDYLRAIALDFLYLRERSSADLLKKPRIQMLYFHHVFTDEEDKFDQLLNRLSKDHVFIPYTEAVNRIINNDIDKPYISFSSDDGFKNNLKAAEIMNRYDISCCFFINPELIEQNNFEIVKKHCNERLVFPATEMLTWKDVNQLQNWGHEIGSHTMSHINIADAWMNDLGYEIQHSKQFLESKCGAIDHFAFPYGRLFHFNEIGRRAVFDAGYKSCATAERGCHVTTDTVVDYQQLALRRDQIIADWKWQHIYYFLIHNALKANDLNYSFPY